MREPRILATILPGVGSLKRGLASIAGFYRMAAILRVRFADIAVPGSVIIGRSGAADLNDSVARKGISSAGMLSLNLARPPYTPEKRRTITAKDLSESKEN